MQARLGILIHSQMLINNKNRLFIKDKIYFCTIKKYGYVSKQIPRTYSNTHC